MTAMLPTASTGGIGTAVPSRTAVENASPCTPYGSAAGHLDDLEVRARPVGRRPPRARCASGGRAGC